jgi:hypothetical protein
MWHPVFDFHNPLLQLYIELLCHDQLEDPQYCLALYHRHTSVDVWVDEEVWELGEWEWVGFDCVR